MTFQANHDHDGNLRVNKRSQINSGKQKITQKEIYILEEQILHWLTLSQADLGKIKNLY